MNHAPTKDYNAKMEYKRMAEYLENIGIWNIGAEDADVRLFDGLAAQLAAIRIKNANAGLTSAR